MLFKWRESSEHFSVIMIQLFYLLGKISNLYLFLLLVLLKLFLQFLILSNDGLRIDSFFHDIYVPLDYVSLGLHLCDFMLQYCTLTDFLRQL